MRRAGPAGQQRNQQQQDSRAAKGRLQCLSAKPFLKDRTNHPNPPLEPDCKLKHVDRNKEDVLGNVTDGARGDGKLGAKSTQHAGHAAQQKPPKTSQRAAGMHPVPPASSQSRGRLPPRSSAHLNPEGKRNSGRGTVPAAALQVGRDHSPIGAPCTLSKGLQHGLVGHKENLGPRASTAPKLNRAFQTHGSSLGKKRVLANGQSSAIVSRPAMGPKDRINNHQAKEVPVPDKFGKIPPGSKSVSQKTSIRAQPLQPPGFLPASAKLLLKNPGTTQDKIRPVRPPLGKPPGTAPAGSLQHQRRPPPVRSSPTKPPASGRPQGPTSLKSSLNPGGTMPRPTVKVGTDRRDTNVLRPGHPVASRGTGHPKQPPSTHCSKTPALEGDLRSRRGQFKPALLKTSMMQPRRVPRIPSAAERKKQLEEWLASKGKKYKRPPMLLLQKQAVKPTCRKVKEKEKQENPEQHCLGKINNISTECLKFVEEPLQELREVVPDVSKAADHTSQGQKAAQALPWEPETPCPGERQLTASTPGPLGRPLSLLPLSVKLQVTSASRRREFLEGPETKFLTPVRRSLRVERAGSRYPEMLKDHDPVVSSLREILDAEEDTQFFFRKNKALPEVSELEGLSSYPTEGC